MCDVEALDDEDSVLGGQASETTGLLAATNQDDLPVDKYNAAYIIFFILVRILCVCVCVYVACYTQWALFMCIDSVCVWPSIDLCGRLGYATLLFFL